MTDAEDDGAVRVRPGLMSDLLRLAVDWFDRGAAEPLERLLIAFDAGLSEGDECVENAVAVSLVEDAG
ncbi:hypothetical protein [Nocardioides sp. URHA0020]|uniref:hypothetical protein n=1 Tax=Nocardioides sp. URHA0020 TaxID=1380392 RepID=UPI0012DC346A|nr:hypothetical protein [Nocardioides sp. URHA0020]